MSKRADLLRLAGYVNPSNITAHGHPFIFRDTPDSRSMTPPHWGIRVKGKSFKGQGWYQYGNLWFTYIDREQSKQAEKDALAWVTKHFPDLEMVKNPFEPRSGYVPKVDLDAALKKAEAK